MIDKPRLIKMKYKIRKPKIDEIKEIDELFTKTVKDNFKEERVIDPVNKLVNEVIEDLRNNLRLYFDPKNTEEYYLIASSQEKIIGVIAYGKPSKLIYENMKINNKFTPEIKSVYILPNYQNKGVGRILFRKILEVLEENAFKEFCLDSGYKRAQYYWGKLLGNPKIILNDYWNKGNHHMIWNCEVVNILNSNP